MTLLSKRFDKFLNSMNNLTIEEYFGIINSPQSKLTFNIKKEVVNVENKTIPRVKNFISEIFSKIFATLTIGSNDITLALVIDLETKANWPRFAPISTMIFKFEDKTGRCSTPASTPYLENASKKRGEPRIIKSFLIRNTIKEMYFISCCQCPLIRLDCH
jgi:hypothetical protein